jgi:hypothetical protein
MSEPTASQIATAGNGLEYVVDLAVGNSVLIGGVIAVIFLVNMLLTPRLEPGEPPLLKPKIPLIGHIIGIIYHQSDYHRRV